MTWSGHSHQAQPEGQGEEARVSCSRRMTSTVDRMEVARMMVRAMVEERRGPRVMERVTVAVMVRPVQEKRRRW